MMKHALLAAGTAIFAAISPSADAHEVKLDEMITPLFKHEMPQRADI